MVNVCTNPALMLNFKPSIQGVACIDLTWEDDTIKMPPFKGNIAPAQKDDVDLPNIILDNTSSMREEPGIMQLTLLPPVQVWSHLSHGPQLCSQFPQIWRSHPSPLVVLIR